MFVRDYLRVLLPLLLVFAAYHTFLVPLLEPAKATQQVKHWETPAIPQRSNWWEEYFNAGSWQRQTPRVVKTDNAVLLFQTREQKTKTRWLFKPLTILVPQRETGTNKRAILIENPEGAEIEFKFEVDWTKELPPVESGQLLGGIRIYSPPNNASKNDGMLIETKDVRINRRRIWTDQEITMELGNSRIDGRKLDIYLDKDLFASDQSNAKKESPFNGLDYVELFYVDRVQIGLNPGGLWPSKDLTDAHLRPAYATLKCKGSFEFKFHQSQAIMHREVHMEHLVEGLPPDTFDCDELRLQVGWGSPTPTAVTGSPSSNWKVETIEAFGAMGRDNNDDSKWLKLLAPGMNAKALGQHLVMNMLDGSVTLTNKLPGTASRESSRVYLQRDSIQIWSPEVTYMNAESVANSSEGAQAFGKSQKTNRLGVLLATGAGQAQMDNKGESWKMSWGKKLLVRPESDKDLMIIEGSANVSNASQGRFTAEQLYLWLTPTTQEIAAQLASNFPDGKVPPSLPDRMKADGDVTVTSPQLRAHVESMLIWFSYPSKPAVAIAMSAPRSQVPQPNGTQPNGTQPNGTPPNGTLPNGMPSNGIPAAPFLSLAPSTGIPPGPLLQPVHTDLTTPAQKRLTASPRSPLNVVAKTMRARIVNLGDRTFFDDLNLEGNFSLTKNQVSDDSPWPFTATGDRMRLSQSQNMADATDIHIVGVPGQDAKVAIGSGWVVAQELRLMQSENQFWIDHPGELVIPMEALQKPGSQTASSLVSLPNTNGGFAPARPMAKTSDSAIRWRELPRLRWGQRMTFDGHTARFGGGVTIDCRIESDASTLWHIVAHADQMAVDMEQPVSLRNVTTTTPSSHPQVSVIRLEGNVDIRTVQTDHQLVRKSLEHIKVPQLDFMVPTQTWLGHGPGELWSRRLGNGKLGQVAFAQHPAALVSNPRPEESDKQCIHLSFIGRMEGSLTKRTTSFYDRIEALIGPIVDWDDEINVHKVERLGRNQSRLVSDQLNIFDASGLSWNQGPNSTRGQAPSAAWEIEAQSRVAMASNTDKGEITVESESLKYAAATDMVRIEGSPRQPAVFHQNLPNSPDPLTLQVLSGAYRLKTGEIDLQVTRFEGALPTNMQPGKTAQGGVNPPQPGPSQRSNGNNKVIESPRDTPLQPLRTKTP